MPRIKARHHAAARVVPSAQLDSEDAPRALRVFGFRLLALGWVVLLGVLLAHYPLKPVWAALALVVYSACLWHKPAIWLFAVPALLPVLDFSAWTGWFYVRECDFLILATLAVGYWRLAPVRSGYTLPPAATALFALLTCSYAISACLSLAPFAPRDVNSFATYQSPFNSVRVVLGYVWAILLLPLLTRSLGKDLDNLRRYFFPGMLVGLGLAGLVVLWERIAFPGLMDFASEYRVTGSFFDMHTGGAALDGYLILTLPFAAVWALRGRNLGDIAAASLVFMLGTYATLVTFTRSTLLAYAFVVAIILFIFLRKARSGATHSYARMFVAALVLLLLAYVLARVFSTGGYRTLAAALGMFAAAAFAGAVEFRKWQGRVVAAAGLLCVATVGLMAWVPRTVYLSYAAAFSVLGIGLWVFWLDRTRQLGTAIALTAFPWLCLCTVLIAWHWGGTAAAPDALLAAASAISLVGFNHYAPRPLWSLSKANIAAAVIVALALALAIPVIGNPFMKNRFTAVSQDFDGRSTHWHDGLAMIDSGWVAGIFGMGAGSFPQNYFWRNSQGEIPGIQVYGREGDNTFLRLGGPRYERGFGELLRVFQTVDIGPDRTYQVSFDLRSNADNAFFSMNICEKWLLYPSHCAGEALETRVERGGWKHLEKTIHSREVGRFHWFGKRPVHLSIASQKSGTFVDVDNVKLLDDTGRDLVKNGDFSEGNARWYFSSDRHHLPWHAKNMLLHVFFEQGWFGLVLVALLSLYALYAIARRALRGDFLAAAPLAALAGFQVVGLFDSLLDVPRLTLLFYLLVFLSLLSETGRVTPTAR